jgi:choline-sulfatase
MVKMGAWKYMYLEGIDELLYDVANDPNELNNQVDNPVHAERLAELRHTAFDGWDPDRLRVEIREDQERRLLVHKSTGGAPTWVNIVRLDDNERYIRNAGAADTKAMARLPYVPPAKPDQIP